MIDVLRRGITLPDRAVVQENPVVWRIVSYPGWPTEWKDEEAILLIARGRPEFLNKETRAYGTPLHAALLRHGFESLAGWLIREGAVLSEKERSIPSVADRLAQMLASDSRLQEIYARNLARASPPAATASSRTTRPARRRPATP